MHRTHFFSPILEVAKNCNPDRSLRGSRQQNLAERHPAAKMQNSQNEVKSHTLIDFIFSICNHKDTEPPDEGPRKMFLETLDVVLI
jgi:hypothetical protein